MIAASGLAVTLSIVIAIGSFVALWLFALEVSRSWRDWSDGE